MSIDIETWVRDTLHTVDAATTVSPPPALSPELPPVRHPVRRVVLGGFAVAATGTAVAAVLGSRTVTSPAEAAARTALRRAARQVATVPFTAPRPDQYLYVRTVGQSSFATSGSNYYLMYLQDSVDETWEPVDPARTATTRSVLGARTFLRPGDEAALRRRGELPRISGPEVAHLPPHTYGNHFTGPSWPFLASLPTDPATLYDRVESYSGGGGPSLHEEMLTTISDALKYSVAPPALVAAFYEVAARVPGVQLISEAVDFSGRRGVAVAIAGGTYRQELVFDDTTGTFLGTRTISTRALQGYPAGLVWGSEATTSRVVDAIFDR